MKRVVVVVIGLALLLLASCKDAEKELLNTELAAAQATIENLQHSLELKQADYNQARTDYYGEKLVADSLELLVAGRDKAVAAAQSTLKREQVRSDSLHSEIEKLAAVAALLPQCQSDLASEQSGRTAAEAECVHLQGVVNSRDTLIVEIKPWFEMYKYNATERNWLEKLFGADKRKPPLYPEPVF